MPGVKLGFFTLRQNTSLPDTLMARYPRVGYGSLLYLLLAWLSSGCDPAVIAPFDRPASSRISGSLAL
ncbi:hypothetical protein SAMN00120144_4091 [Hymenobacter roseosalivarius DSM 11622]|uniref:Uncharacterized protein n=1 Tax=Hymenobacter roseosalivarius DSM 11622 TaxID=645990 RepID=A0A1W1W4V2_9BACT|nr:hypothetical protein SAMN00120144_4091 [Hymenobacter roseosalivarius DSM 11622]